MIHMHAKFIHVHNCPGDIPQNSGTKLSKIFICTSFRQRTLGMNQSCVAIRENAALEQTELFDPL